MSRIIAAVILTCIMLGLCISDRMVISGAYDKLYEKTEICEASSIDEREGKAKELKREFEDIEGKLSIFVNHDILDEIAESVAKLNSYATKSEADYFSECAFIKLKLEYIKKDSGVNLHSIF